MSCEVEQIADCGDISSIARALFIPEKEDENWLSQCSVSLSPCGNVLAIGYKSRLCLLTTQWISSTESNTYLIVWSGTLPADITAISALPICPTQQSSQNVPDWFCIIVGFKNGSVGFYTNTGHLLLQEKLDDKPVMKITCHTGTYGTLPDDVHILFQSCECIITGASLFQTLKTAKAQLARVQAGILGDYTVDSRNITIRKWMFSNQETLNDAAVVGLELKNTYDHLLAASTYGGYDTWYRSIPPVNTLILGAGVKPYVGYHYALEGGTIPPLHDVARAVANKIKSALPGWLGGANTESTVANTEPLVRSEPLSMRNGLFDPQRQGTSVAVSPDRRLAAVTDSFGRVAVLDIKRGHMIRLFKGNRDAQCAFVQIYDADNKIPKQAIAKEIKRAIFLIIYNPKKGLIDIRLMQRGNRVAVFTATKNGKLIYNTCGLVGAEKNYAHRKLNVPEFQCVLIDPDGKLKKFNIPFFYALDGEHSHRSKDLHILRELRDYIKKTASDDENFHDEIVKRAVELKTVELKKHCIEMLIRNYEIAPKTVMCCIEIFWNSIPNEGLNATEQEVKCYFANLTLVTLFYRRIHNEITDDMQELADKVNDILILQENSIVNLSHEDELSPIETKFHLLEDDNCILEKLLHLAQENSYKEHQHAKVKFADNVISTFKEFVSCFVLEGKFKYISLKPDSSVEKLNNLATDTFKTIFRMEDLKMLSDLIVKSRLDPKEIVKLIIMHIMNMSLDEINIELIEKFIAVLYYLCCVSVEATEVLYNEISPWWQDVRDMLIDMPCPLRSMVVAMACKAVEKLFEHNSLDEDAWESLTSESAKWGMLIGRLEDISILSIILMSKETFNGETLSKLQFDDYNINLKYIYTRGKGAVTELIAKWLCSMGVPQEAVIVHELMETLPPIGPDDSSLDSDDENSLSYLFIVTHQHHVDDNPTIFKWMSLLRRQFPLSTSANYIIANMCWEYAMAWQKNMQNTNALKSLNTCLVFISDVYLRMGLKALIWSTYFKHVFEVACRLVNKVGRSPKDPLCLQDVGMNNADLLTFLNIRKFFENYYSCVLLHSSPVKNVVRYEKIWDQSTPSLVEVAQDMKKVDTDILILNYQICLTTYFQYYFNFKFSKPLDTLYDIDYQYIFDALTGNVPTREISLISSEKIRNPRFKFVTKVIRNAINTITIFDCNATYIEYNNGEYAQWFDKLIILMELWKMDTDFLYRQQTIGFYFMGYDSLAQSSIGMVKQPDIIMQSLLAISIQRLKRSLEHSKNQKEWIACLSPHLYKRLQTTPLDTSIPAHPSLATTISFLNRLLFFYRDRKLDTPSEMPNIKLANLIIENCEVLHRRKL
ncbi:LOW QUALITY PROTEIN: rab3 GTPase activating protein [Aphomia sociella]